MKIAGNGLGRVACAIVGAAVMALAMGAATPARAQCTHLSETVNCPPGVPVGSMSIFFNSSGDIVFQDSGGMTFIVPGGFMFTPFTGGSGGMGGMGGMGGSGGIGGLFSGDIPRTAAGQTALTSPSGTQGGLFGDGSTLPAFGGPPGAGPVPGGPPVAPSSSALTTAFNDTNAEDEGIVLPPVDFSNPALPGFINDRPPPGSREKILEQTRGTGDIALAAELLAKEGAIVYDQSSLSDLNKMAGAAAPPGSQQAQAISNELKQRFSASANEDNALYVTRGACFDFVHLAAYFAGSGQGTISAGSKTADLVDPDKMTKWDGESDIPRGQIIIGTVSGWMGGQDQYGFFHVGVSLGHGLVANNHGSGVQIERIEDVFGAMYTNPVWGKGVYYGSYDGYKLPDSPTDFLKHERDNNKDILTSYAGGFFDNTETPEQRAKSVADLNARNAIIDYQLGKGSVPGDSVFAAVGSGYTDYLAQGVSGANQDKPFFFDNFTAYQKFENPPAPTTGTQQVIRQVPAPTPPEGQELAKLFVDYFNISEVGDLNVPPLSQGK